jgi:hypothetical protein
MFEAFRAGVYILIAWIVRGIVVKFGAYTAMFLFVTEVVKYLAAKMNIDSSKLASSFSALPEGSGYFITITRLDIGLQLIISAIILRFIIRRIPMIG